MDEPANSSKVEQHRRRPTLFHPRVEAINIPPKGEIQKKKKLRCPAG